MPHVFGVGTMSDAMQGKRLLEKHGIRANIRKMSSDPVRGCGYGLWIDHNAYEARSILGNAGFNVSSAQERGGI